MLPPDVFDSPSEHEAFGRIDQDAHRLANEVVEHLYEQMSERTASISSTSERCLLRQATVYAYNLVFQAVVLELSLARECGVLPGETPTERYEAFFRSAGHKEYVAYFLLKYPVAEEKLSRFISELSEFFAKIETALAMDRGPLQALFEIVDPTIVDIQPTGDPHQDGQRTCVVTFAGDRRVLFKPRSSKMDRFIRSVIERLGQPFTDWLRIPQTIESADSQYHWQQWVDTELESISTPEHHRAAGGWLAVSYLLSGKDLHFENLLPTSSGIWGVDLECFFAGQPILGEQASSRAFVDVDLL